MKVEMIAKSWFCEATPQGPESLGGGQPRPAFCGPRGVGTGVQVRVTLLGCLLLNASSFIQEVRACLGGWAAGSQLLR